MRRESPIKRRYPSGQVVWVARYTGRDGKHHIAKPVWNRGKGTFARKADAQRAIEEAYGLSDRPDTLGEYFATWTERHPRSERTNATNEHRISRVTDVEVEGMALRAWPMHELRRRHALALVDHMLRTEGRATTGAVGILRSLSAMTEDAITDEVCDLNPFKGVRIRANDPRAQKKPRPIRVFSFEEMHRFAKAAGRHEAMVRVFTDTGMRLGEVLPLRREDFDGETLQVRRTAHEGVVLDGTKTDHGEQDSGRTVPVSGHARLDARSPDQSQWPRLRPHLHDPNRPHVARAKLLPRRLAADPESLRPRHSSPRVPPQLRHPPPRRRRQRRRLSRDRRPPSRDDAGAIHACSRRKR
jgi:integrase